MVVSNRLYIHQYGQAHKAKTNLMFSNTESLYGKRVGKEAKARKEKNHFMFISSANG